MKSITGEGSELPALEEDTEYLTRAVKFMDDAAKMNNAPLPYMIAAAFKNEDRARLAEAKLKAALSSTQQEWISVDQELPPKNETVLVAHWIEGCGLFTRELKGWHVWFAMYNEGWKRTDGFSEDKIFHANVKFWQPLPAPPTDTKGER